MAFVAVYAAIGIGLLLLSRFFLKGKTSGKAVQADDAPTTLSTRGTRINYVIGRRRAGPYFGWAGDEFRYSQQVSTGASGGKGLGGGGGEATQTIWFSPGWHSLSPGIGYALYAIFDGNEQVWKGPIFRESTPSGTVIDAGDAGSFTIYWGELDQAVDQTLETKMGIGSRWPGVMHVVWNPKNLGTGTTWGQLEYDFEVMYQCVPTFNGPYLLDDGVSRGVNPAHVIAQLLTGRDGWGAGLHPDLVRGLQEVSDIMVNEHLPMNLLIEDQDSVSKVLEGILADIGAFMPDMGEGGLLFLLAREESGLPVFDDDIVMAPDPEITADTTVQVPNRATYTFKDVMSGFRDQDIGFSNDIVEPDYIGEDDDPETVEAEDLGRFQPVQVELSTVTDLATANKVSDRRAAEPFGDSGNVKILALREASKLIPGQAFVRSSIGTLRVMAVQRDVLSARVTMDARIDSYSVPPDVLLPDENNSNPNPIPEEVTYDLAKSFVQLPNVTTADVRTISVFRIRSSVSVGSATVWVSADGDTYSAAGAQNGAAAGGPLTDMLDAIDPGPIEDGPSFEALNSDVQNIRDLSGDTTGWESGVQLMLIGNEVFFLRNVTAVSETDWAPSTAYTVGESVIPTGDPTGFRYICTVAGTSDADEPAWPTERLGTVADGSVLWEARGFRYQTHGLIRAQLETDIEAHGEGDTAFIIAAAALSVIGSVLIRPGANICIKTQVFGAGSSTPVSGDTAFCKIILT